MKQKSLNSLSNRHSVHHLILVFNIIIILCRCSALRCRTDEGPSELELKRATRNCMRKFDENVSTDSKEQDTQLTQQQQHHHPDHRYTHRRPQYGRHYDDSYTGHSYGYNIDNSHDSYPYNRNINGDKRNRGNEKWDSDFERMYGTNLQYDYMTQYSNDNASSNDDYKNYDFNQNRRLSNNNNNNNRTNVSNRYNVNNNHKSYNSSRDGNKNQISSEQQKLCVVHCFFEQLNMLNGNDYPDRYKVTYVLTRDIHDRELRSFFLDTIQECFRYLESERRSDKCQFSRDLVNCMTEYAQAYCEDWNEFHLIFN